MKKRMLMLILCALILSGGWLVLVPPEMALACSCAAPPAVKDELARKTAVFAGKVKSVVKPGQGMFRSSADPVAITFEVADVWKGELKAETKVYTAISSASCGYEGFEVNKEYMVFAHGTQDKLETNICSRTKPLASAGAELSALGAGYKPAGQTGDPPHTGPAPADSGPNSESLQAVGSLALILMAAVTIGVIRRRRRQ